MKRHRLVHIRLFLLSCDRKIKRRNVVIKRLNIERNRRPRYLRSNKAKSHNNKGLYEAIAPEDFSYSNISKCISFIQDIDMECRKNKYSTLKVNLDLVTKIGSPVKPCV